MKRIHYIYLTINQINNKKYIGQRLVPKNIEIEKDKYLGSGIILLSAIKKHGKDNFKKEILETCHSRMRADELEKYYFNKYDVLNKKEEFYNRALPGQYWREKGHSAFVSDAMKKHYSNPENIDKIYIGKHGITKKEYDLKKEREKEKKGILVIKKKRDRLVKNLKKEIYNYYRKLTADLRKEYNDARNKTIWTEKKSDPDFLDAVKKGKENSSWFKHKTIIYDYIYKNNKIPANMNFKHLIQNYLSGKFKTKETLEINIRKICENLNCYHNINIKYADLVEEAKLKYSHLYG